MTTQKKEPNDSLKKEFLVRLLDQETAELVADTLNKGLYPNRNKLINECIKGHLTRVIEKANPEETIRELFQKEMNDFTWKIKNPLDDIKKMLLLLTTIQHFDDKALGYLITQVDHVLSSQAAIATLPEDAIKLGNYDKLPQRLEKNKQIAIAELLSN